MFISHDIEAIYYYHKQAEILQNVCPFWTSILRKIASLQYLTAARYSLTDSFTASLNLMSVSDVSSPSIWKPSQTAVRIASGTASADEGNKPRALQIRN